MSYQDVFNVKTELNTKAGTVNYFSLEKLARQGYPIDKFPYSIKVLLEAVLRQVDGFVITEEDVKTIATWNAKNVSKEEIPFKPARVIMQDFTGVPGVVDLAAMRDALNDLGGDPENINPVLPVDLVIDHSVQVDVAGSPDALQKNAEIEFNRNKERYEFLKWGASAFSNFKVIPPDMGIIHQVNLEYIARVVQTRKVDGEVYAYPDSLVGTDSHTVMINGLGVVGWGVGGIEAEAVMLDQPVFMLTPEVIGFKLTGKLQDGITATDLILRIVQMLREYGVVGKFVEFYGEGIANLALADRATIANMAPEYGATMGFFPVDEETLNYLRLTGRSEEQIDLVEKYAKAQGLFWTKDAPTPEFTGTLELDMSTVEPSISGPSRPQDRIALKEAKKAFYEILGSKFSVKNPDFDEKAKQAFSAQKQDKRLPLYDSAAVKASTAKGEVEVTHGSTVIAAITSCTNTSNPSVLIGAGLLAKKAVEKGLSVPSHVKASLAPGSRVVTDYLKKANLLEYLEKLNFYVVGYGCTTCIGNSGPIDTGLSKAIQENDLVVTSVLSGNRNFEGRIHPDVKANYLASPPLVVAYALAGTMDIDFNIEPIGRDKEGKPVYLADIWPSSQEISEAISSSVKPELFQKDYGSIESENELWNKIQVSGGKIYNWSDQSTYIRKPTFFEGMTLDEPDIQPIEGARVIAFLGDSVTTDHISPAGTIAPDSPAGKWLQEHGVQPKDFNSYGSRRGNHEVMMRGTFANIRIRNRLVPGVEGGYTKYLPTGEQMTIYDAAMKYKADNTPLVVVAGKEYGTGSSRDWAAKGTALLGIKAVIAESFERIHRSNLIGMGVLPLQFLEGENADSLGLDGTEVFTIPDLNNDLKPRSQVKVIATKDNGKTIEFQTLCRLDTPVEVVYYRNGGILHKVLRDLGKK
ncbi:MAG: aconitate hydratase AcnA [Candidatus Hydrogenedentota bacterium]|nr:MAG: aconitate hydratase AcnA [Candidatus Hydrogenedentota bacterium]